MKYNPNQILAGHKKDVSFITSDLDAATAYRDKLYSDRQYLLELQRTLHEELPNLTEEKLKEYQDDFDGAATEATELWRDFEMAIDTVNDRINCLEEDDTYFIDREKLYTEEDSIARRWLPYFSKSQDELYCETENYQCSDVIENIQGFFNDLVFFYRRGKDNIDYCDVIYKGDIYTHPLDTYRNHLIKLEQEKKAMNETKKNSIPENAIPILSLIGKPADNKVETPPETIAAVPVQEEKPAVIPTASKVVADVRDEYGRLYEQSRLARDYAATFKRLSRARKDLESRFLVATQKVEKLIRAIPDVINKHDSHKAAEYLDGISRTIKARWKGDISDDNLKKICGELAGYLENMATYLITDAETLYSINAAREKAMEETPAPKETPAEPTPAPTPAPDCLTITHETPWYVIVTPKKPDTKTLAAIKGAGFRWYSAGKRWSLNEKYANPDKLDTLKQLKAFGGDKDSVTFNTSVPDVHAVTIKEIQEKAFDDLVKSLNDGHPLWLKSWFSVTPSGYSYASDKSYSLRNNILLAGHSDFYLTEEGAEKVALEHGHTNPGLIAGAPYYYILAPNIRKIRPDENGKYSELTEELIEMEGEERATTEVYGYRLQRVYPQHFFNPDAVPPKQLQKLKLFDNDRDTEAEKIVSQFITKHNIVLNEIEGSANPTRTRTPDGRIAVNMPSIRQFQMSIAYYSVLFHELTHAANRIRNCQLTKDREELSAEIGSWIILNTLGFDASELIGDMASYCKSYINVANEKNAMRRAYTHALASANLVLEPIVQRIKQEEAKLASNN